MLLIRVSFHQKNARLLARRPIGLVQAVEYGAFMIDLRLRCVDVFRYFWVTCKEPSPETDKFAHTRLNRKHNSFPKPIIVAFAVFPLNDQTGLFQGFELDVCFFCCLY